MYSVITEIAIRGPNLVVTASGKEVRLPAAGNRVEHLARAHLTGEALQIFELVVAKFGGCDGVKLTERQR